MVRSLDEIAFVKEWGNGNWQMVSDSNLYTYSNEAAEYFYRLGMIQDTIPVELNRKEILRRENSRSEMIIYGRLPLMITAQCSHKNTLGCMHPVSYTHLCHWNTGSKAWTCQPCYGADAVSDWLDVYKRQVIWMLILGFANEPLIRLFLHEGGSTGDIEATLLYAKQYLQTVMPSMVPFALIQAYAQTLRETGETVLPMKAGIASVAVNLMFDYVLIFGAFGLPALGVRLSLIHI